MAGRKSDGYFAQRRSLYASIQGIRHRHFVPVVKRVYLAK